MENSRLAGQIALLKRHNEKKIEDIVADKLAEIIAKMEAMETIHLYHLNGTWKELNAQRIVLQEIIATYNQSR